MNSDSKYLSNKNEIININNIFFEDSFIDLINNLSSSIGDLYKTSIQLIKSSHQLIFPFESNLSQLLSLSSSKPELFSIIKELTIIKEKIKTITNKTNENIEIFKDKAKKIFAEMKIQKKIKVDALYNDYARKHSLKNEQQKLNIDPLRKSNPNNEIKRNKTLTKANEKKSNGNTNQNKFVFNFNLVKVLINKLGEYNTIIKNHSVSDYENFNKIQKQLSSEINKIINMNIMKNIEGDEQKILDKKTELEEKNPFIMVNNNSNNVTMTTTNNNSYYNIIDKDNLKELKSASFHSSNKSDLTNDINIINNKNIILEKKLKEYEEEMKKTKEEYELKYKILNDKNTSLSKDLVNKNHEIQMLQNSNKQKISEITKLKLIQKNNEKQLKVKKAKAEQQREKSPGNIKIKDLLGNKKDIIENKKNEENLNNNEQLKKLEEELKILKDTIDKKDEYIKDLEKNVNEGNKKSQLLKEEINLKNMKINDDDKIIINLKSEKDKLINKIKDHKNLEESYKIQLDSLKVQIKEMNRQLKEEDSIRNKPNSKKDLKKQNNELKCENVNLQYRLEYELNFNKQLKEDVKKKEIEIDGLQIFIKKLMTEKELNSLNKELNAELLKKMDSNKRINTDSGHKYERDENTNKKNIIGKYDNTTSKFNQENERNKSAEIQRDLINK